MVNSPGEFPWSSKGSVKNYRAYVEEIELKALKDPEEDIIGAHSSQSLREGKTCKG